MIRGAPGVVPAEMSDDAAARATCIECGNELPAERAELGYRYCTRPACQAVHHRAPPITAIGNNKSADTLTVADPDEIKRRGDSGELARKDTGLGVGYRSDTGFPAPSRSARPVPVPPRRSVPAHRRPWTVEQEKVVRLYHDMGLNPGQIATKAQQNNPRLAITERLAVSILSALPRR